MYEVMSVKTTDGWLFVFEAGFWVPLNPTCMVETPTGFPYNYIYISCKLLS